MLDRFDVSISRDPGDMEQARRLRARVFGEEFGIGATDEADSFDASFNHLLIRDRFAPGKPVVATTRVGLGARYTSREFGLSRLLTNGARVAETGRTCIAPNYRGGVVGLLLFKALLDHLTRERVRYLVGTASFRGADPEPHMPALCRLRHEALAPAHLRPIAIGPQAIATDGPADRSAMRNVPALIKTYLRAGAWVGDGAWCDEVFNSVDVCVLLDMNNICQKSTEMRLKRLADA